VIAQQGNGWAICHDQAGILLYTACGTRSVAIKRFLDMSHGKNNHSYAHWRRAKREGWRASHIIVDELIFGGQP
jgi:hypothetical protein